MTAKNRLCLGCESLICVLSLLCLCYTQAERSENVLTQTDFYQSLEPNGEYMFQFDEDEIFHVDLDQRETRWRLPQFGQVASFDASGALADIAVLKNNLDVMKYFANDTKANNVPPSTINIYPENPVVLGEPNQLNCLATKFFPPVIKMTWLKNGKPVTEGESQTDYYPAPDGSFSMFLYLATIPQQGEVYTCSVEHAGLPGNPTNKLWSPEVPRHVSETTENIICGLGLFYGMCGVILAIVLICKGMKNMNDRRGH